MHQKDARDFEIDRLQDEVDRLLAAGKKAEAILSRWLAHQYSHQEQFVVLREARDALRIPEQRELP